jgi:L-ornithine Nalpha-acyltransferase
MRHVGNCVLTGVCPELSVMAIRAKIDGVIVNVVSRTGYRVALATDLIDRKRALALRQRCFRSGDPAADDGDGHDALCRHLVIQEVATGDIAACCRFLVLHDGRDVATSYAALHYDLRALSTYPGAIMEVGRFCIDPARRDPDILRLAWGALTRLVDRYHIEMLFGCSSFSGGTIQQHRAALAMLAKDHAAPDRWAPGRKSATILEFADCAADTGSGVPAPAVLPPLLRSYLAMGGWVSDHAVIDRDLDTIHVFTAVEIAAIPALRARALRMMAAEITAPDLSGD